MNEQRARVRVADQAHGLAVARLARAALDAAWDRDLKVTPLCPDIAGYMRRHPEYITLVDERHRADVSLELAPIRAGRGRQRARLFQRSCAQCMQSLVGSVLRAATCSDNFAVAPPRTLAGFCSRGITAPSREGSPGVFMWSSTVSESPWIRRAGRPDRTERPQSGWPVTPARTDGAAVKPAVFHPLAVAAADGPPAAGRERVVLLPGPDPGLPAGSVAGPARSGDEQL